LNEVIELVLGSETAPSPRPLQESDLPGEGASEAPVALRAVRDVNGVDALAPNQRLEFDPSGLTVVYGINGSGKSGFGRILRLVCQTVAASPLRPNAFVVDHATQTARIRARRGDQDEDVRLDLADEPPKWLSAVKVFDGDCAHTYITSGEAVEHVPEPLGVLSRCADAQSAAAARIRDRAAKINTSTEVSARTDIEATISAATLTPQDEIDLENLEQRLALLKNQQLEPAIAAARANAAASTRLAGSLARAADDLDDTVASRLERARRELAAAVFTLDQMRSDVLDGQPVSGTGTEPWRAMWEAARAFVAEGFPPKEGAPCPLCQRELDRQTSERLAGFEAFVTSDLEARVATATRHERQTLDGLPDPQKILTEAVRALATLDEALREAVLTGIEALSSRKNALQAGVAPEVVDIGPAVARLRDRADAETARAADYEALRSDPERESLSDRIADLHRRQTIGAEADALRAKHGLLAAAARLDTGSITRQQRALAKLAISDRLVDAVRRELGRFGGLGGRVEAGTSGSGGRTVLRVKLKDSTTRPGHILSEGEHRAVALSFFLAQASESASRSAIVFDDPVSSLDHLWREEIAERLASEAVNRQVIVFTHDLAFLAQLSAAATYADVPFSQRFLNREHHQAGVVTTKAPFVQIAFSKRAEELRHQVEQQLTPLWDYNRDLYDERAIRWITDLRKSWEMLVEEGLLRGVVRRYDPRIYTSKLKLVHMPDGAVDKVHDAFRQLSGKAHHEAPAVVHAPSPPRLLERLGEFEQLVAELRLDDADALENAGEIAA
jgi:ABC-type transport system involved in cytochrome c biogenesis ATPase subunit